MSVSTQQSQSRQLAIHGMWALPLLCGVVAFGWARLGDRREELKPGMQKVAARKPTPLRSDVEAALSQAEEANEARRDSKESLESSEGDGEKMRAYLIHLKTGKNGRSGWDLIQEGEAVAKALGRKEGAAGLRWISDNVPPFYQSGMDGWAESDPDGAFETIVSNQRFNPCSPETLTMLLQRRNEAGPGELAAAIEKVPWHLWLSDKGEPNALYFHKDADVSSWLESGVLPGLMKQHVGMKYFVTAWFAQDPSGAMAGWRNWPDDDERGVDRGLEEILTASSRSKEQASQIDQMISDSDAATLTRFVKTTKRLIENDPYHDFGGVVAEFPHLNNLIEPLEPAKAEDQDDE